MKGIILIVLLAILILVAMAPEETNKQGQPVGTTFTIGRSAMHEYSAPINNQVVPVVAGFDSPTYSQVEI